MAFHGFGQGERAGLRRRLFTGHFIQTQRNPLGEMREFAHIAGPVMIHQPRAHRRVYVLRFRLEADGGAVQEMREQQRNILLALAQGRY